MTTIQVPGQTPRTAVDADLVAQLDALPSLAAFYDADLTLRACTPWYAAGFGRTPAEMHGLPLSQIVPPHLYARAVQHAARVLTGRTEHVELEAVDALGRCQVRRLTLVPFDLDGEAPGFAVLTDRSA